MSSEMAWRAASLMSSGAEKSGKPCDKLTALCFIASRVISRITDSVNKLALRDTWRLLDIEAVVIGLKKVAQTEATDERRLARIRSNPCKSAFIRGYGMICSPEASRFNCSRIERIAAA